MSPSLEGFGVVRFDSPGGPLFLSADGARWTLDVPRRAAAREAWNVGRALRRDGTLPRSRRRWSGRIGRTLHHSGLRLEVRAGDRTVAVFGRDSRSGWLSRLLAGRHVELRLRPLLAFLLGRSR